MNESWCIDTSEGYGIISCIKIIFVCRDSLTCDMTHWYDMWHDSLIWLIDMVYRYMSHLLGRVRRVSNVTSNASCPSSQRQTLQVLPWWSKNHVSPTRLSESWHTPRSSIAETDILRSILHQKITRVFICRLTKHYMSYKALNDI